MADGAATEFRLVFWVPWLPNYAVHEHTSKMIERRRTIIIAGLFPHRTAFSTAPLINKMAELSWNTHFPTMRRREPELLVAFFTLR